MPVVKDTIVMENPQGKYVYKLNDKGLPELNYIKTMSQVDGYWTVSEGLKKGDKILTGGLQKVIPGKPIKIMSDDAFEKMQEEQRAKYNKKK